MLSTLDLATGYRQIPVHPDCRKDSLYYTAMCLPISSHAVWTKAHSVFQRLMERVLAGLNSENGLDFVAVHIDDVIVFSRTLDEHLQQSFSASVSQA